MVKQICALIILCILIAAPLYGDPWQKTLTYDLKLTQTAYSDSWTGGEAGNLSWVSTLAGIFEKQFSPKYNNKTSLNFAFGQTHIQDEETKDWDKPKKSTDKIDIENLSRLTLQGYVDPYFAARFESQFVDASVDSIKRYINPMLFTESAGISRVFYKKDKDELLSRLGFAFRQNVNSVIVDSAAHETDWNTATDGGIESVTDFVYQLSEKLQYVGKLSLFKALFYSEKDKVQGTPQEDYWKAVDANWENTLTATVASYITVSLYTQLLYDKQVDKRGRFKQTLGFGLTYKLY